MLVWAAVRLWLGTAAGSAETCSLSGRWMYCPEGPSHSYEWRVSSKGVLACFHGLDGWREARGWIQGSNLTLSFGDPSCPGAGSVRVRKWGEVQAGCSLVVMHDTQPNCQTRGSCTYGRIPNGSTSSPFCPPPPPLPPSPPPSPMCPVNSSSPLDVSWLSCRAHQIIQGCQEPILNSSLNKGINATSAYTPDASHSYGAQWTRDFYYTVSGAADLMDAHKVEASVRYTFAGQREDGCMPDRVQINGDSVMAPGGELPHNARNPSHDHAWDNGPFSVLLLASTVETWRNKQLFCDLEPQARRALDFVNRSSNHLVYNDPVHPNCTYGFTDTVAKTGNLLFCSLLYVDASRRMAALSHEYGCGDSVQYAKEAAQVSSGIDTLADPDGPLWLAASLDNAYPDVWGSAYLVALNLSTAERRHAAMLALVSNPDRYFRAGQVRSLPLPHVWTRCDFSPGGQGCTNSLCSKCPPNGTYQNGGFWATPLSYITAALLNTGHASFAQSLLSETIADFKLHGIFEDVDYGSPVGTPTKPYHGVLNYTASATNVLWAARLLELHRGD